MGYIKNVPLTEQQQLDKIKGDTERANLATIYAAISDETSARESVDAEIKSSVLQLQTALENEITLSADSIRNLRQAVTDEIADEIQERILQDSNLQASLENAVSNLQTSIQAEKQERISGDSAIIQSLTDKYDPITNSLSTGLANEITLSARRDETIFSNLSASIQAEKTARENANSALQTAVNNESTLRAQQTTSLGSAISAEVTARTNAVANLQSNLSTAINNEATLRAKNDNELSASIRAVYTNINDLVNIDEFSPSTTTKNGKSGIVPAPPKLPNTDTKLLLTSDGWEKMADTAIFIGAVPSQNGTLEYTGSAQSPSWINYDDSKLQIGGTTSATNTGTFTATFTPRGLYCWSDGTRTARNATWSIKPKTVQVPTAAVTSYEYTGNSITIGIANPNADATNKSGTDTATNAATYTVTFALKSTSNYIWSDNTTSAKSISWSITPKKIAKPTAATTAFTYNGNSQSLSVSNYDATYMNKSGTDTATAAASYSVTYSLKNTTNLHWSDNSTANVVISWSIAVLKLAKPTASTTEFEYNGSTKTLSVTNYNSNFMTESGTKSQVNAGTYNSIYTLKDKTNSKWDDNSTADVTISWKINRMKLSATQSTFSQSGTLTYTGNSQNVSITNYNSTYHELSSTTSAVAAGNYIAKVSPKSNYAFSDGSTTAKSVNWSIGKKTFNKPTASTTEYEYTGNNITLSVTNYDATYMNKSGTDTAVAEGNYSVTYTLKDTSNYQWNDSSNSAVTINWKIKTNKIAKPTISAGASQEFTGNTLSPTIAGYDANKMSVAGNSTAVNAGTYTLTYALKDTANTTWQDGSTANVVLTWYITRKKLTSAQSTFSQSGTFTYDGNAKNISSQLSGYNSTYHELSSDTSKTAAGSYIVKVSPKSNYAFSDGSTTAKTVHWSIGKKALAKPSASVTTFEYDGSTKTLSVANYNSSYMTQSGAVSSSAKGNYTATYTLNDTANYMWNDLTTAAVNINWSIGAKAITKPARTDSNVFTYDGNAKTITISGYDSTTMTFSGTLSETNAGNYTATYALKDPSNCTWADGSTADFSINWSIARAKLSAELSTGFAQGREVRYYKYGSKYLCYANSVPADSVTGYTQYVPITNTNSAYHSLMDGSKDATTISYVYASTYKIEVHPKANYSWNDGTITPVEVNFVIGKCLLAKPTASVTSYKYTGSTITLGITNNPSTNYVTVAGNTSATNVGNYSVTFKIKDGGCQWADGTTADVTLNWEITVGDGVTKPTLTTSSVEWSGGNVSPTVANYDSSLMSKSGTDTAVAIGTYTITYSLKDKSNTKWAGGGTDDITLTWYITRKKLSTANSTFSQSGTLTYNGNSQNVSIAGYNSTYHDLSSQTSMTNAGNYTAKITPKATYCWSDGTFAAKSCSWTIQQLRLTKPTLTNTSYTYDGNSHSPTINNFNSTYENYAGSDTAINATTYTLEFTLKNTSNTTWADSTTSKVSLNWVINKATPTLTLSTNSVAIDHANSTVTVTATYTGDGALSGSCDIADISASGSTITISAKPYTYYDNETATAIISATAGSNYNSATFSQTIQVTSNFIPPFKYCSWSTVQKIVQAGKAALAWDVGDWKTDYLSQSKMIGSICTRSNNLAYTYFYILGFDHNSNIEGTNRLHMCVGGNAYSHDNGGKDIAFTDEYFGQDVARLKENGTIDSDTANATFCFTLKTEGSSVANYTDSLLRARCQEFYEALPTALQNVIVPTTKYFSSITTPSGNTYFQRPQQADKVWILGAFEVFSRTGGAYGNITNIEDQNYVKQYDYYKNGNSPQRCSYNNINQNVGWHMRDTTYYNSHFECSGVNDEGQCSAGSRNYSLGFVPCFCIG